VRKLHAVASETQNQRGVRTILLAAGALAVLTNCQSPVEKQRLEEAQSDDFINCARIPVTSSGCGRNSGLTEVYVDNMHKNQAVRVTIRKHSPEGDDDTDYAIAEGGHLFLGCGGGGTSFAVVDCEVLKREAEKVISNRSNRRFKKHNRNVSLIDLQRRGNKVMKANREGQKSIGLRTDEDVYGASLQVQGRR
jgi:hypothetical protein